MLEIKNVTKYYGEFKAVDNLSMKLDKGEIYGLLGVNGAGKTTTFRMIMGLLEPNSGVILLDGKKIDSKITDKIGFLTEERSLLLKLTVLEQCLYYGALKSMTREEVCEKLDYYLERFNIKEYKNRKIKELSKGNQQKIQFITSLINDPVLLILDEPFSGLDPVNVELFREIILEMKEKGTTIIFSSHQMIHVEQFCKNIVILLKGKIVLEGDLAKIKEDYAKKNIFIKGSIDITKIKEIKGVIAINLINDEYKVEVEHNEVVKDVFKALKNTADITKFVVEKPTLNEIFIAKVGENYE